MAKNGWDNDRNKTLVWSRIEIEEKTKLRKIAEKEGTTPAAVVRTAIQQFLAAKAQSQSAA